jgi:hypothetical protein
MMRQSLVGVREPKARRNRLSSPSARFVGAALGLLTLAQTPTARAANYTITVDA